MVPLDSILPVKPIFTKMMQPIISSVLSLLFSGRLSTLLTNIRLGWKSSKVKMSKLSWWSNIGSKRRLTTLY
jgi:hypothetical protein